MTVLDNFLARVSKSKSCWTWTGNISPSGYGRISIHSEVFLASRVSWELHHGPLDAKACVLHRCDNRKCVNPAHLFLGTRADNVQDMLRKKRWQPNWGEANGRSKLTAGQVLAIRKEYKLGGIFQYHLAKKYGVSQPVISKIIRNEGWVRH